MSRFGLIMCVLCALGVSLGVGCGDQRGLVLQGLTEENLKTLSHAVLTVFDGAKVTCEQLTPTNYSSDQAPFQDARKGTPVNLFITSNQTGAKGLPEGENLLVYLVAVRIKKDGETETKEVFAQGCQGGVTLKNGEIRDLTMQMKEVTP